MFFIDVLTRETQALRKSLLRFSHVKTLFRYIVLLWNSYVRVLRMTAVKAYRRQHLEVRALGSGISRRASNDIYKVFLIVKCAALENITT